MSAETLSFHDVHEHVYEAIDAFERKYPLMVGSSAIEFHEVIAQKEMQIYTDFISVESLRDTYAGMLERDIEAWERPIVTYFDTQENVILISMTSIN